MLLKNIDVKAFASKVNDFNRLIEQKTREMKKAEAEGIRLIREAEAEGIKMIREAKPDNAVLTIKGYEALGKVADGKATKIFAPANLANVGSLATAVAEAVKKTEE
jgi:regulator of protease activity HflC (stomatin/prohibitin superfamily)